MMVTHALFPTVIGEFQYPKHEEFRQLFFDVGLKHFTSEGYSEEETGHVTIHHDPAFEDLYKYLSECIEEYLATLNVDSDNFNINIVKSWLNVLQTRSTPTHSHKDAHISFVYYVNAPESCNQAIRFHNERPVEPFAGCVRFNNSKNVWNVLNSYTWQFMPQQGTIFVFPASVGHDTLGGPVVKDEGVKTKTDLTKRRISIASDAVLTYKEKSAKPLGIQPVSNWRSFK